MDTILIGIRAEIDIYFAQSEADKLMSFTGFGTLEKSRVKIIISELAFNIIKYAGSGLLRLTEIEERGKRGIQIESTDKGPGIPDVDMALLDNYSSSGTLGLGLPGIKRIADSMKIETAKGEGTHVIIKYFKP